MGAYRGGGCLRLDVLFEVTQGARASPSELDLGFDGGRAHMWRGEQLGGGGAAHAGRKKRICQASRFSAVASGSDPGGLRRGLGSLETKAGPQASELLLADRRLRATNGYSLQHRCQPGAFLAPNRARCVAHLSGMSWVCLGGLLAGALRILKSAAEVVRPPPGDRQGLRFRRRLPSVVLALEVMLGGVREPIWPSLGPRPRDQPHRQHRRHSKEACVPTPSLERSRILEPRAPMSVEDVDVGGGTRLWRSPADPADRLGTLNIGFPANIGARSANFRLNELLCQFGASTSSADSCWVRVLVGIFWGPMTGGAGAAE